MSQTFIVDAIFTACLQQRKGFIGIFLEYSIYIPVMKFGVKE